MRYARGSRRPAPTRAWAGIRGWRGLRLPGGEQRLIGFGVAFYELGSGELIVLDQFVNIVYGGHLLKITSRVGTYSLTSPLCDHPTLFSRVRGRRILRSSP